MIYDCFTFFNEITLLKLRLEILNPVVDTFVIVEANRTQKGDLKLFNFETHKNEFAEFLNKIVYIKVEDSPIPKDKNDWAIEFFQRNCILRGITFCNPEDIIMISDLDEIPHPDLFKNLVNAKIKLINTEYCNAQDKIKQFFHLLSIKPSLFYKRMTPETYLDIMPLVIQQSMHYYFINCAATKKNKNWYGTIIVKYKNMQMPQTLRNKRNTMPVLSMKNAGWHFSYLGGKEQIKKKLVSIMEGELFTIPETFRTEDEYIEYCLKHQIDIFARKDMTFELQPPESVGLNKTILDKYRNFCLQIDSTI